MNKILSAIAAALLISASLTSCASTSETGSSNSDMKLAAVGIDNGWVRVSEYSDHVGGMTGAFATFTNNTEAEIKILGGSAEIATMVEAHEVAMSGGKMVMQPKEGGIVIPAGESLTLEPGGLHIMLMGLKKAIATGDEITLTIDFEGADDQTVTWLAKESAAGDEEYKPAK